MLSARTKRLPALHSHAYFLSFRRRLSLLGIKLFSFIMRLFYDRYARWASDFVERAEYHDSRISAFAGAAAIIT